MDQQTSNHLVADKIGLVLQHKRIELGLSPEECAGLINVEPGIYSAYEAGEQYPSMPEIEALSYYFDFLPEELWELQENVAEGEPQKPNVNFKLISKIRCRSIGAMIRQYRLEAGLTADHLAQKIGISNEALESYELGETAIPFDLLERISEATHHSLNDFLDRKSPIGSWAERQRISSDLNMLPEGLKAFAAKPINRPYLELAKKLSEMPVDKLREIAEGLLEITL
jgi:transcriptional regulator with XRE-family HTH domain